MSDQEIKSRPVIHLRVTAVQEDEDHFSGDLWIDKNSYALFRAELYPSENPTGIKSMHMAFELDQFGQIWLPTRISLRATISFLLIFKGQIKSEIEFEDYQFEQAFPDLLRQGEHDNDKIR
jgi:hypothetical protein